MIYPIDPVMKKVPMTNETPIEYHDLVESLAGELPSIPLIMNDLLKIITDSNAALFAIRDVIKNDKACLLYTSPSPRDPSISRMPSSA